MTLLLVIALSPLAIVLPALVTVARRWWVMTRRPYSTATYEYRYGARSIVAILVMDTGLILLNVLNVLLLGGSFIVCGTAIVVILLVVRWELRAYRKLMAKAHQAENEEIAKLGIPEYPPDDL